MFIKPFLLSVRGYNNKLDRQVARLLLSFYLRMEKKSSNYNTVVIIREEVWRGGGGGAGVQWKHRARYPFHNIGVEKQGKV
jgi:hypothetical protein